VKAKRIKGLDPAAPLAEGAAETVKVRLAELLDFLPEALVEEEVNAHHDMRIAAKRLRYVLEATGFCLGKPADEARKAARELQDLLGEMHDADVMLPRLAKHRAALRDEDAAAVRAAAGGDPDLEPALAARAPHRTAYRGLEVYEVYLLARRSLLHQRFSELCAEHRKRGVWRALEQAADRELEAGRRRREAAERALRLRLELEAAEREQREAAERGRLAAEALAEAERQRQG
jgi:hypothetical protein